MKDKIVKQYLKKVADNMVCESAGKAFVIRELEQSVASFAEEKPDLTLQDLYAEFGTPEEFALHLSDQKDFSGLIKKAKKKTLLWICLGIVGILLGIAAIAAVCIVRKGFSGTIEITEITGPNGPGIIMPCLWQSGFPWR